MHAPAPAEVCRWWRMTQLREDGSGGARGASSFPSFVCSRAAARLRFVHLWVRSFLPRM
jgi:hypothetical protein